MKHFTYLLLIPFIITVFFGDYAFGHDAWTSKTAMPSTRRHAAVGALNGILYVTGGGPLTPTITDSVWGYNPSTDTWALKSPLKFPREEHGATVVDTLLYIMGGHDASAVPLDSGEIYNPATDLWSRTRPMPGPRFQAGFGADTSRRIYRIGGRSGATIVGTVERYNIDSNTWDLMPAVMPTPRHQHAVVALDGNLYCIGGADQANNAQSVVEMYNPYAQTFTSRASLQIPRRTAGAAAFGGNIFVFGGSNASGNLSSVEKYDPIANIWTIVDSLPSARSSITAAVGVIDSLIYVVGGNDSVGNTVSTLFAFDPSQSMGHSLFSRSDSMLLTLQDTMLVGPEKFPGDTIFIPIWMNSIEYNNGNGIYSFQTEIVYNDSLFPCIGYDSMGTVLGNYGGLSAFIVQFRKDSDSGSSLDTLRIAAASDDSLYYPEVAGTPFVFPRPLIKLKFRIPTTAHNGDSTILHFARFMFNEGVPGVSTDDGSIKLRARKIGDVDKNNLIQPYDAVLVLRHVIRDTTLDAESREAAEVSGNGEITAYDAALILMHYVGKITTFPVGDYYKNARPSNRGADIVMEWGEVKDGILSLMVNAKNLAEVYGYSFELSYDPSVLSYQGAGLTDWTGGMINAVKTEDGRVSFAAAGSEPIEGDGALAQITFRVKGDISAENIIQLTQLTLNEEAVISTASSVGIPKTYALEQNYPNPFNPETRIRFQIPEGSQVSITIYNLLGQKVKTLVDEARQAGTYDVIWDGTNDNGVKLASGVYVYRMKAGNFINIKKLVFVK